MDEELNNETLDVLDARIKNLEDKVIGKNYENFNEKKDIISTLALLGSKLGNALSTRDRMMMVMKRMEELERYLDPTYGGSSEMTDNVKTDLIISQEDNLIAMYDQLNKLSTMKKCLDSQDLADTLSSLNNDLINNWQKQDETTRLSNEQSQKITYMFDNYNSIIMTLTETFVRMEDAVTKAEAAAMPKKIIE